LYKSVSGFVDTSYRLGDRFTLGAGVRYFRDQQDFSDFVAMAQQSHVFDSVDPRAYAAFKVTNEVNVYASAAKGFRSGGFNTAGDPPFGPEDVWTYELGAKMGLLENQVTIDTAVFLSNYSNFQTYGVPNTTNGVYSISDVGKARIKGIEWDLAWVPSARWRLDVRGDYLDGRFTEINATQTAYEVGDTLDTVPRYQFTVSGQHDFSWLHKPGFIRLDYSQQGPETSRNRSVGPWYYGESDIIHLLNLNTSLMLNNNLRLGVFAQNLLNDQGFANPFSYFAAGVRPRPRTVGVDFGVTFD
jgi:outer membrane receptor protein involved in Fe transport